MRDFTDNFIKGLRISNQQSTIGELIGLAFLEAEILKMSGSDLYEKQKKFFEEVKEKYDVDDDTTVGELLQKIEK